MSAWLRPMVFLIALVAASCSSAEPSTTTTPPRATTAATSSTTSIVETDVAARLEDLDYLDDRVIAQHPDPFWRSGEEAYRAQLGDIRDRAGDLSDLEFGLEVIRLVALVDGHSLVMTNREPLDFARLQIRTYWFDDGLFVLNSHLPEAVGGRVTAIGGVPVAEAMELVEPYVSRDNEMTVRLVLPIYLTYVELLEELGILDGASPAYTVEIADGTVIELDPPELSATELIDWLSGSPAGLAPRAEQVDSQSASPLYLSNPDRTFWWTHLEDSATVFIQMNRIDAASSSDNGPRIGMIDLASEVSALVDEHPVKRVVLDLRHNPGGNNTTYGPILDTLASPGINQDGMLFVIVGRQTFSAAMNLATEIENETLAVFAGEPTGARPNLYGDVSTLRLPNSGITVRISTRYWPFGGPDDTRPWIDPTIDVPLTSADYFAGRDPVLEAIIRGDT